MKKRLWNCCIKRRRRDQADICICGARKYNQETGMVYPAGEYLVKKTYSCADAF